MKSAVHNDGACKLGLVSWTGPVLPVAATVTAAAVPAAEIVKQGPEAVARGHVGGVGFRLRSRSCLFTYNSVVFTEG